MIKTGRQFIKASERDSKKRAIVTLRDGEYAPTPSFQRLRMGPKKNSFQILLLKPFSEASNTLAYRSFRLIQT